MQVVHRRTCSPTVSLWRSQLEFPMAAYLAEWVCIRPIAPWFRGESCTTCQMAVNHCAPTGHLPCRSLIPGIIFFLKLKPRKFWLLAAEQKSFLFQPAIGLKEIKNDCDIHMANPKFITKGGTCTSRSLPRLCLGFQVCRLKKPPRKILECCNLSCQNAVLVRKFRTSLPSIS